MSESAGRAPLRRDEHRLHLHPTVLTAWREDPLEAVPQVLEERPGVGDGLGIYGHSEQHESR
ncbi:MAG: hypothetical protein ACXV3F_16220 [Frankiaceae bacterium]